MIQCSICKEFFNPALLSEVFEHEHKGIYLDKEYFGHEVINNICGCGKPLIIKFDSEGNRIGATHSIEDDEYHCNYFRNLRLEEI